VSRIQKAIDDGTSDAIADRLSRAAQFHSVGDWQRYTSALSEALTRFPQSREKVEGILSTDIQNGRDFVRTGGGPQALEIAKWVRTVLPDFAAAQALESEAKAQVVADALKKAQISGAKGAFDEEQSVLVAAIKIVSDDQQLQSKLASIQDQLEAADRKKMADAKQAAERAATGRRAADLAEAMSTCRAALDSKDYTSAPERCGNLVGIYPQESAAKTLIARLRIEVPLRVYRSHAEAEQILALPETVPSSVATGKVGNTVDWHGSVRMKTVDNYYVIDTSSGSFVIRQKAGEPFLRIGQAIAAIGKIESWPTIGTLGSRPQIMPMLRPDRID
jgi:cell division protein ZapA (FtsZ GTPase activity inhibitor)